MENVAAQIYDNVKAATDNIPSQGNPPPQKKLPHKYYPPVWLLTVFVDVERLIVDALMDEINAGRPIPLINISASTPEGIYSLNSIVSETELNTIETESIYALPDEPSRLSSLPYK